MEYTPGQVVFSKSGHDKGLAFIVMEACDEYIYLADGKHRKISKPKRKNIKHIQKTNYIDKDINRLITEKGYLLDSDLVKALKAYIAKIENKEVRSNVKR